MKWLFLWAVCALLQAATAQASDEQLPEYHITPPIQAIPEGDDVIVVMTAGEAAPFDGQLYDPMTALRWSNWLTQMKTRLVLDVQRERRACDAKVQHQINLLEFEEERGATVEEDLRARILSVETRNAELYEATVNPSWFRSMEFGVVLGVVGSAAVAIAVGYAAGSTN